MENEIVKKESSYSFIERLVENANTLEQIKEVGMVIIKSGFCPEHFKQSQDAVGAIMCIDAGKKIGLSWMQSLSDIYPVKGRIGIMGTAAKAVIFASGVLESWEEMTEGEYPNANYKHITISKRKDLPKTFRTEFSVYDAQVAGLMQKDIYRKYGKRMIAWRDIGFHASDYYQDILKGMKTIEELNDFEPLIPESPEKVVIETTTGATITIPDKEHAQKRAGKLTERVADKIPANKYGEVKTDPIQEAVVVEPEKKEATIASGSIATSDKDESPFIPQKESVEYLNGKIYKRNGVLVEPETPPNTEEPPLKEGQWTAEQMEGMDTKVLLEKINSDLDMTEAMELIPGKNTNKKLRAIIMAWQEGRLAEHTAPFLHEDNTQKQENTPINVNDDMAEIKPNKDFDKQKSEKANDEFLNGPSKNAQQFNKYAMEIPPFDKGNSREFGTTKKLFNALLMLEPPINNVKFLELGAKLNILDTYKDKEAFCKYAPDDQINLLLNAN